MKKILLVDDDEIANFLSKSVISECASCEIEVAGNGEEALRIIAGCLQSDACPDLIFLDLNMPVMSGQEFLIALQELPEKSTMKIIVLSSSCAHTDIDSVIGQVKGYLTKPLTADKFRKVLEQCE